MNTLPVFALEHYLLQYEHLAALSLCGSGLDSLSLKELLAFGDDETLALWEQQTLGYSEPQGHPGLRQEVGHLYPGLATDSVVLFSGAAEAIWCGLQALLSPGDHCIVITPCYQSLRSIPENRCATTTIALQATAHEWILDMPAVRAAIRPNTRMLVMNFPNNPTGALPSPNVLMELIALARERGLYIFSDEVYRGLELGSTPAWPALAEAYEKGVSIGSLSKLFALPGLRCGWLACQDQSVLARVTGLKHYTTICNNTPGEILALMALRAKPAIIPQNRAVLGPRYSMMQAFLNRHAALFDWIPPQGGCLVFPSLKGSLSAAQFALDLLKEEKVLALPGQLYDFPGQHLRLSYAGKTLPQALQRVENFISRHGLCEAR
jgi:aspartate/methionine/tyrosine aminotransferase